MAVAAGLGVTTRAPTIAGQPRAADAVGREVQLAVAFIDLLVDLPALAQFLDRVRAAKALGP
jgi:hypothetical protein